MGPTDPRVKQMIKGLKSYSIKEFADYRKRNYTFHVENARLTVCQKALAH